MSTDFGDIVIVTGPVGAGKSTVAGLTAAAMPFAVHLPIDTFESFVVAGRAEPSESPGTMQNRTIGGAVFASALQFAFGGYTVIVDGFLFPEVLPELGRWISSNGVVLHYAVLRPDLSTCIARAEQRAAGEVLDVEAVAQLHARFEALGEYERHVIDHRGAPGEIAGRIGEAVASGRLEVAD